MRTIIQTPTGKLDTSLKYFATLDFEILSLNDINYVTDGNVIIEVNPDRNARTGIKLIKSDWKAEVLELKEITTVLKTKEGYLTNDPSGAWIYLIESNAESIPALNENINSKLGDFAGISIESISFKTSKKIWEILGFKTTMGGEDQGWVSLKNSEDFTISIMTANSCPHLFFNPSLTYFNGEKNLAIIDWIRKSGVSIAEEITTFNEQGIADNIVLQDPGGLGFFLFSD